LFRIFFGLFYGLQANVSLQKISFYLRLPKQYALFSTVIIARMQKLKSEKRFKLLETLLAFEF